MQALNTQALIAVIGAGAMGVGIAQVAAQAGHQVRLFDMRDGAAGEAIANIDRQLGKRVANGKLDAQDRADIVARLRPADSIEALADSHLVIEAIVENLEVKRGLFTQLETLCSADCILASNTSSLSITALAAGMQHPQRVVGMHFFNPAPVMALVEVVSGLATAPGIAQCVHSTAAAWGKKPVHTRSTPGFIVNRVARPFYAESLRALQEGAASSATLDALMREAGAFRMGAFELTDLIGHDVNYAVTCSVFNAYYNDMRFQPSLVQKELVDAGHLGRKSGQGFYSYAADAAKPAADELSAASQVESCVLEGSLGAAQGLIERIKAAGVKVIERDGSGVLRVGDAVVALSDGRMACQRSLQDGHRNLVLLDLAKDYSKATRIGLACAQNTSREALDQVVSLLARCSIKSSLLADIPGLAVMRTVAMLANEAADAALHNVGTPTDIDLAMCAGVNYPMGPLAWADEIGLPAVLQTLDNLQRAYGEERYRPSLLLRRKVAEGSRFHD
ncbi:3-hydroxyacyl-CoA dehydrogenase PaaH [Pseudomonas segetis]|uniref:3-hydroxyacyl-CoA dehydrogenase n=1 Tax=Pseudomonas segetis TaxID=298908 RepID=A0A239HPZ2_9PSED|nr:3-hydroxyacyl-CoA dehydrogenase PaaH [Pseudomonas segetis]SNS83215.1 3-hydroxyacyl-CoA dehydrogenase [Pseudomonas segetis]